MDGKRERERQIEERERQTDRQTETEAETDKQTDRGVSKTKIFSNIKEVNGLLLFLRDILELMC